MNAARTVKHDLGGGACEIAVYDETDVMIAVVSHPFVRAPWWFLHRAGTNSSRGEKFQTCKAAIEAA